MSYYTTDNDMSSATDSYVWMGTTDLRAGQKNFHETIAEWTEATITRMEQEIEELREGMSRLAVDRACTEPHYLQYLRKLIQLEDKAEAEVGHFEWGDVKDDKIVNTVNILRRAVSPNVDDVLGEELRADNVSPDGMASGGMEKVGRKWKGKGKAKEEKLRKWRKDVEERDSSSNGAQRNISAASSRMGGTLVPQSTRCIPVVKKSRIIEANMSLGRESAGTGQALSYVFTTHWQVDFCTRELLPAGQLSPIKKLHTSLITEMTDVPSAPPVDFDNLLSMPVKEEDMEADAAAMQRIVEKSKEWAAWKAERRAAATALAEEEAAEEAEKKKAKEEKVWKKAAIDTELTALIARRAKLEAPSKPKETKPEPRKAALLTSDKFVAPPGWHIEGKYLIEDEEMPHHVLLHPHQVPVLILCQCEPKVADPLVLLIAAHAPDLVIVHTAVHGRLLALAAARGAIGRGGVALPHRLAGTPWASCRLKTLEGGGCGVGVGAICCCFVVVVCVVGEGVSDLTARDDTVKSQEFWARFWCLWDQNLPKGSTRWGWELSHKRQ
ncbi:hypothetical protein B0H14DRAFT_3625492 [Mycena olivaceomarginata]|nr:hypothetical protein B0H14DRAFT_3625492 [Mycena olivaceomarginata]